MKAYPLVVALVAFFFPFASNAAAQTSDAKAAEEGVRKLERAWLDAYEQRDAKAMEAIVADDFIITFPQGRKQTKAQIVESMKKPTPGRSEKFRTEGTEARVFGDTVVLTGRVISETQRDGTLTIGEMLYTDTYVRRNGVWQVVASHLGSIPEPKPKPPAP